MAEDVWALGDCDKLISVELHPVYKGAAKCGNYAEAV